MNGADARYPRSHRLLKGPQFQRVFKHCEAKAGDRYLTVLAVQNNLAMARLGTAISIKIAGNAVRRNRLKRLVRESFRLHLGTLSGWDLVVLARPGTAGLSNRKILGTLERHWQKIAGHAQTHSVTHSSL